MINLNRIFTVMKGLKNIGFSYFFLLIFSISAFASGNISVNSGEATILESAESVQAPAIYKHIHPIFLEIEGSNFTQNISEVHKLLSVAILSNRIVPLNFDFRSNVFIPIPINFNSPLPIFIKGHSLRN